MSNVYAYVPGISLAVGSLLSAPYMLSRTRAAVTRQAIMKSPLQPPGWVFMVAWTLQAVSLGFVGQGIGEGPDAVLKDLWLSWASALGPLYALSVYLSYTEATTIRTALWYNFAYVTGLLALYIIIIVRALNIKWSNYSAPKFAWLLWPTLGWLIFAWTLTVTSLARASSMYRSVISNVPLTFKIVPANYK